MSDSYYMGNNDLGTFTSNSEECGLGGEVSLYHITGSCTKAGFC